MSKRLVIVSTLALNSALLMGSVSSGALAQEKAITALAPQSGWAVARIDGNANTNDSYCALSRPYEQGMILTLGRNSTEEYSLAIDFQSAKLNPEKAYSVTLQPGPSQIRAYEMMPASQRAMVIRLGYDDSFFRALDQSSLLKAEIDGTNYQFKMDDFKAGEADLNNCLAELKGKPKTKVASNFSAEKVDNPPPMKTKEVEQPKMAERIKEATKPAEKVADAKPSEPVKVAEAKTAAPAKPIVIEKMAEEPKALVAKPPVDVAPEPAKAEAPKVAEKIAEKAAPKTEISKPVELKPQPRRQIEITRVESKQVVPEMPKADTLAAPKAEKTVSKSVEIKKEQPVVMSNNDALLPKSLVSKQVNVKPSTPPQVVGQTALQKQQREALDQLKADNERLNKALQAEMNKPAGPDRSKEVAALQKQINDLQTQLQKEQNTPDPVDQKLQADVEKLKAENEQLKLAMQAQEKAREEARIEAEKAQQALAQQELARKAEEQKMAQAVAEKAAQEVSQPEEKIVSVDPDVMKELNNLKQENSRLSAALQGQEQKLSSFDAKSPQAVKELEDIKAQLRELQAENQKLYDLSRKNRGMVDTAVAETSNQALKKMREYEKKLEAAQNDNLALSKEIEELRRMQEDGRLASVSGDWDLEQATKRYNEAEREIKRLGLLLEQQRMAHRQEKAELEDMLFDPAVTDQEQRRRLAELELQLSEAERELKASGRQMPQRPVVPVSPMDERVTLGSSMTPDPVVSQQRENLEIQRLNNKIARQNQQLQAYNSARQSERMAAVPQPAVSAQPLPRQAPKAQQPAPRAPQPATATPPQARQQPAPQPQPQRQPQPVAAPKAVASTSFDQGQLQSLLNSSGVSLSGKVVKQSEGQYRWNSGNLVGQAQIIPAAQGGSIDQFAQNYIAQAKRACGGDFASLPSTAAAGQGRAFEIACISPSRSTSSSVIFTQKGNDLIAISHESAAENMDMAMDARDRIAAKL